MLRFYVPVTHPTRTLLLLPRDEDATTLTEVKIQSIGAAPTPAEDLPLRQPAPSSSSSLRRSPALDDFFLSAMTPSSFSV